MLLIHTSHTRYSARSIQYLTILYVIICIIYSLYKKNYLHRHSTRRLSKVVVKIKKFYYCYISAVLHKFSLKGNSAGRDCLCCTYLRATTKREECVQLDRHWSWHWWYVIVDLNIKYMTNLKANTNTSNKNNKVY